MINENIVHFRRTEISKYLHYLHVPFVQETYRVKACKVTHQTYESFKLCESNTFLHVQQLKKSWGTGKDQIFQYLRVATNIS